MSNPLPKSESVRALSELAAIAASIFAGVVIAYILLSTLIIPRAGFPGDLGRIIKLEDRLDSSPIDSKRVVIVANSVGVEGLEANAVQQQLPTGFAVENQSSNGLDLLSGRIYIERVLQSDPNMLIWVLRPELSGRISPVNPEVASAMRFAHFIDDSQWLSDETIPGLDADTRARLESSDIQNNIALRTIPIRHLNSIVRVKARQGILPSKPMELNAPFQMDESISGQKLQRHLGDIVFMLKERTQDNTEGIPFIQSTVEEILKTQTTPILVIPPTHPAIRDSFTPAEELFAQALDEISKNTGVVVIDLSKTLSADEFADAIHPNRDGAKKLSTLLGQALIKHLDHTAQE
mgnify:CR=1 FL=1|tara:strand:+ start:106193 stop:107242 length:1050 start_codon:yes stop_codon:yes gene_type:complete